MKSEHCEHARNFGKITCEDTKSKSYIPQSEMAHAPKILLYFSRDYQLLSLSLEGSTIGLALEMSISSPQLNAVFTNAI